MALCLRGVFERDVLLSSSCLRRAGEDEVHVPAGCSNPALETGPDEARAVSGSGPGEQQCGGTEGEGVCVCVLGWAWGFVPLYDFVSQSKCAALSLKLHLHTHTHTQTQSAPHSS